ncbi:MAG: murein L,D-transpeptidase, partial [Rhodocyclales bacterium CG17_big_fil_post_rev_8_21_14_2_50_68_7]
GETFSTALRMNVIVGRALDTQTPMLIEELRRIEFRPYWNIPPSIARKEVVPRLRREPEYLAREAMEFVPTRGGRPTTEPSEAMLEAVLRGEARIRQRPGPRNALGAIKFMFPNNANIYLHHTPGTALFARGRRDFSHGCIRVEAPVELARFVLEEETGWDEARILAAMREDASPRTLRVRTPIPVLVFYTTAVAEEDGRMFFLPDLYGHDAALDAALRQRP